MSGSEIKTFDGLDNRKDLLMLFLRLGSDRRRAAFLESLIPSSLKGFAGCPMKVVGPCDPIRAYHLLLPICNELGVSINEAARRLEAEVKSYERVGSRVGGPDDVLAVRRVLREL